MNNGLGQFYGVVEAKRNRVHATDFFSALVVFVALSMSFCMCISIVHTIVIESVLSIVTVYLLKLPGELFLKT